MDWLNNQVGKEVANFDEWVKDLKVLAQSAKEKNYDAVVEQGEKVRQMYPDYVYAANAYEFLAEAYLEKGNRPSAAEVLTEYEKRGGRNPEALKKLALLEEEAGDLVAAAATLDRINYLLSCERRGFAPSPWHAMVRPEKLRWRSSGSSQLW